MNHGPVPMILNPAIYDLQGRRIQGEPQKGLYIQNGKKILK